MLRHLYPCRAEVLRLSGQLAFGTPTLSWSKILDTIDPTLAVGELWCRVDLAFVRPGKDQPMPIVAGRAPDRIGIAFYDATDAVKAGDCLHMLEGPVSGMFEIRVIPDPAIGLSTAHHMEVQVVEVAQDLVGIFPGGGVDELP